MKKNNFFSLNLPDRILGIEKSFLGLFLAPLALFLLFLVSFKFILIPKINEVSVLGGEIKKIKNNTNKLKEQNKYLASIDQEELEKNADYLDNAVLKDKKSYLLVGIIRGVANKFDYQITSFSLTPGEMKGEESTKMANIENSVKLPISLSLIGPKEKSLELILALEKTLPILFIDKFEKRDSSDTSELDLVISSYYIGSKNVETSNVALSDLILSKEESELITEISSFNKIENNPLDIGTSGSFKEYQRENPFSL